MPDDAGHPELNRLVARLRSDLPESARPLAFAGLKRVVDFQDVAYGDAYIDRLKKLAALDAANGGASKISPSRRKPRSGSRSRWPMTT